MGIERREKGRRAEVVKAVVDHVVHKAESTVTLEGFRTSSTFHMMLPAASCRAW
jgi:hypothetical protein